MNAVVLKQTHASPIFGPQCRARWCWEGEAFTGYGAWVPKEVLAADDQLTLEGLPLPDDAEVLDDLTPILSPSVLPPGHSLAEPPPKVDKAKLQAIRERLIASAAASTQNAAEAPAPAAEPLDPGSAIELAVARRHVNERDETITAQNAEIEALRAKLAAAEAKAAPAAPEDPGKPGSDNGNTVVDPIAAATGGGQKKPGQR